MKRLGLAALAIWALVSCKEKNELINLTDNGQIIIDSSYVTAQLPAAPDRVVYIEDYTGVRCKNCPEGHEIIEELKKDHPGRFVSISMHDFRGAALTKPYPESKYDFRISEAEQLAGIVGAPATYPSGIFNRKKFGSATSLILETPEWVSSANSELPSKAAVNISSSSRSYNPALRELSMSFKLQFLQKIDGPVNVSIALVESGMVDLQLGNAGVDSHYVHNNVLRRMMESYSGKNLGEKFDRGRTFVVRFNTKLKEQWVAENMKAIVFVSRNSPDNKEVLQAFEIKTN